MRNILFILLLVCATSVFSANRTMGIVNNSNSIIIGLFGSNVGRATWEENILHGDLILPGEVQYINFYDGTGSCVFDLKAVFSNGVEIERDSVNVCKSTFWTLY